MTGQKWNTTYDDAKYEGWMFGGVQGAASTSKALAQTNQTNSEIKTAVDVWYKSNIVDTGYNSYVHDTIFCNDRSFGSKNIGTGYGAMGRFRTGNNSSSLSAHPNPQPQFTCPQNNDKFTVSEKNSGNGVLTYPVGLITTDEVVAAGSGKYNTDNTSYYLYKEGIYWTITPEILGYHKVTIMFAVIDGLLYDYRGYDSNSIAPVINLKPKYLNQLQGDGTLQNPYFLN